MDKCETLSIYPARPEAPALAQRQVSLKPRWTNNTHSFAGLAVEYAPIAFGTETDGSVIMPASRQGLIGFKPSVGLVSRDGICPESRHQDTPGILAHTVKDAAIAMQGE
jgi:hypothetical protein